MIGVMSAALEEELRETDHRTTLVACRTVEMKASDGGRRSRGRMEVV
jgi:hypothetical protein